MKSALFLLMGSSLLASCAIVQSSSCRKAAQGDIPCQGLKGLDFQNCQVEVRRAVTTCQTEQMHGSPDSVGVYRLPPPDPNAVKTIVAPKASPVEISKRKDTVYIDPPVAKPAKVAAPSAPKASPVDSVAKVEPPKAKVADTMPPPATAKPTSPVTKVDSTPTSLPAPVVIIPVVSEKPKDSLVPPKGDSVKDTTPTPAPSPVLKATEAPSKDSIVSPSPKKPENSEKPATESAAPSDSTATPLPSDSAKVESTPADTSAPAAGSNESIDASSFK